MAKRYDLIVIGSGPAGRRAAIQAAKLGKSVLILERGRRVGGVSVHTGTIPSKTLRETVLNLSGFRERGFYGQNYKVKANISAADLKQDYLLLWTMKLRFWNASLPATVLITFMVRHGFSLAIKLL